MRDWVARCTAGAVVLCGWQTMDEDNDTMAPAFEGDSLEQRVDEDGPGPTSMSSVSIENDTSWLAGGGVGYHLQVHTENGARWACVRRYSEFATLREVLVARCQRPSRRSALVALPFPEKRWLGSADLDTVRERRRELERWTNGAIALCPADADMLEFLSPNGPREAGLATSGGSGSLNSASGVLGSDAEDWAELEKVRQLRESLLQSQLQNPVQGESDSSGLLTAQSKTGRELEPEPEPGSTRVDDDLLEILIREAAADAELDSNFSLPSLRNSGLAATASNGGLSSPTSRGRRAVAADLSQLETPPRPANEVAAPFNHEVATPSRPDQHRAAEKNAQDDPPAQDMYDAVSFEGLLRAGGKRSLEAVCAVLDRVVPLLDVPQKHTPRRRRRMLEDRVEKLLELLRPTESGSELQQRWAAAAALMQLEPNVASKLAAGLAELVSLPTQSAYVGYTGLSAAAVVTLASVLRTLELAAAGRNTGNLLEQEVLKKLSNGGENAVACVAAALDHCLALVDVPQPAVSRRYRRALEHDILEAQSCLERGLGLKISGRGLQPPLLDALVQTVVSVQQLVPSELLTSDATPTAESPLRAAGLDAKTGNVFEDAMDSEVATAGLLSDKIRLDSKENNGEGQSSSEHFVAMQRLLRLLICPDTEPEVMNARKDEARVTELRVARRREQRITAVLARKAWGAADEDAGSSALPTATERLRLQQEEEASAMLRMRVLEAKEEMKDRQKEARQARLALNRQRRALQTYRRRRLGLCVIASSTAIALILRSNPAASQRFRQVSEPIANLALAVCRRVHVLLGSSVDQLRAAVDPVLTPTLRKLQPAAHIIRQKLQVGVEFWAWMIDGLVHACLRTLPVHVLVGQTPLRTLRLLKQALVRIRRR